jgi:hypothetical protein
MEKDLNLMARSCLILSDCKTNPKNLLIPAISVTINPYHDFCKSHVQPRFNPEASWLVLHEPSTTMEHCLVIDVQEGGVVGSEHMAREIETLKGLFKRKLSFLSRPAMEILSIFTLILCFASSNYKPCYCRVQPLFFVARFRPFSI